MTKLSGIKLEMVSNTKNDSKEVDNKFEALEKLNNLKNKKIISKEEFEKEKQNILR